MKMMTLTAGIIALISASTAAIMTPAATVTQISPVASLWTQTEPGVWGMPFGVHFSWTTETSQQPDHYLIRETYYPKLGKPVHKLPFRIAGYIDSHYVSTDEMHLGERVVFSIAACVTKDSCSLLVSTEYIIGSEDISS